MNRNPLEDVAEALRGLNEVVTEIDKDGNSKSDDRMYFAFRYIYDALSALAVEAEAAQKRSSS